MSQVRFHSVSYLDICPYYGPPTNMTTPTTREEDRRVAVVAGGTSGIGLTLAHGFEAAGYDVHAFGIGQQPDDEDRLSFAELDVTDDLAVTRCMQRFERVDVLVNAAGIVRRGAEHDPAVFTQVVDVNLNGAMRMCAAARQALARCRGSVINIASMLSYFGGGLVPAYAASKGGIAQLTRSLAIAYAPDAIRVNAVAPGWIATPLTTDLQDDDERSAAIVSRTPLGRWGEPADLVGPALFLASDAAGFVTGTLLNVDGGYSAA